MDSSLAYPDLLEHDSHVFVPDQPLVEKSVYLARLLVVNSVPKESSDHTTHVLLISVDSHESKSDLPILVVQEIPYPILV